MVIHLAARLLTIMGVAGKVVSGTLPQVPVWMNRGNDRKMSKLILIVGHVN